MPVIDSFQINEIFHHNAFECPVFVDPNSQGFPFSCIGSGTANGDSGTGIWRLASFSNHSCIPNANRYFLGDLMVMRTTKDIAAGDEIFNSYITPQGYAKTNTFLAQTWHFVCTCPLCQAEKQVGLEKMQRRTQLLTELTEKRFHSTEDLLNLIQLVGETFDSASKLPRFEIYALYGALYSNYRAEDDHIRAADSLMDLIEMLWTQLRD